MRVRVSADLCGVGEAHEGVGGSLLHLDRRVLTNGTKGMTHASTSDNCLGGEGEGGWVSFDRRAGIEGITTGPTLGADK